jgi:hypothetical protein
LRTGSYVLILVAILFAVGCGSSDSDKSATATSSPTAKPADTSTYRAAVNALFDDVIAARGVYNGAHGASALRQSAVAIADADQAALAKLHAMQVPSTAKTLNSQLVSSLGKQETALKKILAAHKLDSAKLGDVVLVLNDVEGLVSQINALP